VVGTRRFLKFDGFEQGCITERPHAR
jgi:hypothetical protein